MRRLALLFMLLPAMAQAQFALARHTPGNISGVSFATVRCTTSQAFTTGTSNNITLPSCKTAGDLVAIFISSQNTLSAIPSGWFPLTSNFTGSATFITGGAIYKQIDSTDVSTGSVTLTTGSAGAISTATVEFSGLPFGGTSSGDTNTFLSTSTTSLTIANPASTGVVPGDTVFYFGSNNGTGPVTSSRGSSLQTTTGALPSVLASEQVVSGSVGLTSTFTYTGYSSQGAFNVAMVVHGGTTYTPEAIPGLQLWVSADCITRTATTCSTPSNGTTITAWVNRYGTANYDNTGAVGTCTFNTNVINSLPAVSFSSCAFPLASTPTLTLIPGAVTVGAAWKNASTAAKGELLGSALGGPAYWTCGSSKQQGADKQGTVQQGSGTAACDTSWHYGVMSVTGSTFPTFTLDGSTDTTINGTTGAFTDRPAKIGRSDISGGSEYLNGQLGELVYYSGQLTSAQITTLNTYLSRW